MTRLLKILLTFTLIFAVSVSLTFAQGRIKEKIKSHKIAYLSEHLALTENEAQKFWPIYNAYQAEIQNLKSSQNVRFDQSMTDAQAEILMTEMLDLRVKEIDIQRTYIKKMKTAIPSRKVAHLFKLEREFQGEVLSRVKNMQKKLRKDE